MDLHRIFAERKYMEAAKLNPGVDAYLKDGCGRCALFQTPKCKTLTWAKELEALRKIVLDTALTEELKWSAPCYTYAGKNIVMIGAFNDNCVLSFFKGALLKDPAGILTKPGENSQIGRVVRFTDLKKILDLEDVLKEYIAEAIQVELSGEKVPVKQAGEHTLPQELIDALEADPAFKEAFFALTPGRQRGYIIHFSAPKQSQTRVSRIEKYKPMIFDGKGFHD